MWNAENTLRAKIAPTEILKTEKNMAEKRKAGGNLLRRISGIHENSDHLGKKMQYFFGLYSF